MRLVVIDKKVLALADADCERCNGTGVMHKVNPSDAPYALLSGPLVVCECAFLELEQNISRIEPDTRQFVETADTARDRHMAELTRLANSRYRAQIDQFRIKKTQIQEESTQTQ
jgi:hypothetical protein